MSKGLQVAVTQEGLADFLLTRRLTGFSPLLQIYRFDNLEKNVDGRNRMDYAFIRIFVEAIQEYDDVLVERLFNEEDIE